ncbi:hypothetical protein LIER_25622 [Lithospermum erythrorhizon]|uniref:LOB domain-containing protein n=1 Tax=Lithospermum erythrorhizon TaxID=34254 RepID=A0AAV3R6R5_LITER
MSSGHNNSGGGPCGACKFLRRKCLIGCIFAPYFDPEQGTTHFAAVHKVFGASNVSKMLMNVQPHKRVDAVVTLCYEALARVRDPVYGCVGHLFALQQQVVNLQAELANTQARLASMQRMPLLHPNPPGIIPPLPPAIVQSSSDDLESRRNNISITCAPSSQSEQSSNAIMASFYSSATADQEMDDCEFHAFAQDVVSNYFGRMKFRPPSTP